MSTTRHELLHAFDLLLAPERFKDYGPNGLQVEGRTTVRKIVSGVTASRALIEAAIHAEADAIFVHHGLFWRGQDGRVTGWMKQRLGLLLGDDVNLFAYHLPLDAHPELGNNAQLGLKLGLVAHAGSTGRFGEQELGFLGAPGNGESFDNARALAAHVEQALGKTITLVDVPSRGPSATSPGAPAGRRATSRPRSRPARTPSSPARSPSPRRTTRARWAWPSWPAATMRPSATARRPWRPMWPRSWASRTSSSTSTTRRERARPSPSPWAIPRASGPRSSRVPFATRPSSRGAASWPATWGSCAGRRRRSRRRDGPRCRSR